MGHFNYIRNTILRDNLEVALDHIVTLIPLSESKSYKKLEKSSFRKTIIIYTASIIEALLSNQVCDKCNDKDLIKYEWCSEHVKDLYIVDKNTKIVCCKYVYKGTKLRLDKLNLGIINKLLYEKGVTNKNLYDEIDKVRELRNEQHFGTMKVIKENSKSDLQFVFSVAKKVIVLVKKQ